MNITFISRSPGTGHSIEMLFGGLLREFHRTGQLSPSSLRLPHISRGLRSVWQNIQFVRKARLSLVHITGDVHYAALGSKASQTVLTIHDCIILQRNRHHRLRFWLFKWLWYQLPMQRAAVVTAISAKTKRELIQFVGPLAERVVVIPNSYDPIFHHVPRPFYAAKPVLLQIGTAPHKNLDRVIAAINGFSCQLCLVGPLTDTIRSTLVNAHIDYRHYTDVSQEQIVDLYTQCDVVLSVSLYEGFGMPLLEGQAVGRPVVASNISPLTEVGGAGACYVDPTDIADIRRGIERVCQDATYRNSLIAAGRENAAHYTVAQIAARYAALYQLVAPPESHAPVNE